MFSLSVKDILRATKGKLVYKSTKKTVAGISTDTRTIKEGDLFIALKGKNFDGHNFVNEAIKKGASGAIIQSAIYHPLFRLQHKFILIKVDDALKAFGDIAKQYRMDFDIPFIGVTGSNGKTTTKEMIHAVLSATPEGTGGVAKHLTVLKNEGTENNLIGLPKTLLRLTPQHHCGVLELGTSQFGEIKRLADILKPRVGIVTNIGPTHLEFLGSTHGVLKEKRQLLYALDKKGTAVVNADDPLLSKVRGIDARIIRFGIDKQCDFKATRITREGQSISFTVNDQYDFKIRILGRHNVYNALAAIAVGFLYGIDFHSMYKALLEFTTMKGRMYVRRVGGVTVIDDTYNANPRSLQAALESLSHYKVAGRKIFVCGDMLELGSQAVKRHAEVGQAIARSGLDYLITVGSFAEVIRDAALQHGMDRSNVSLCKNNNEVLGILRRITHEDDVLLVKGSRRIGLDEVVNALPSFISPAGDLVRV